MNHTDKIAQNFAKAYQSYHQNAHTQATIAKHLLVLLDNYYPQFAPQRVLEIGCGTGFLTQFFCQKYTPNVLYLNDLHDKISQNLPPINADIHIMVGDVAELDWKRLGVLDAVVSSSCLQWVANLGEICRRVQSVLVDDGVFAFSSFLSNNLKQIKHLTGQGLQYHSQNEIKQLLIKAGLAVSHSSAQEYTLYFDDPKQVLRHIKDTGVTLPTQDGERFVWNKASLSAFCQGYHDCFGVRIDGVWRYPLTYEAVFVLAQKLAPTCRASSMPSSMDR